eukprot:8194857-Lingulodinium_polyedra.AAC.1
MRDLCMGYASTSLVAKVAKDLEAFGAVHHPIDQTVLMFYSTIGSTVASVDGSFRARVDDF